MGHLPPKKFRNGPRHGKSRISATTVLEEKKARKEIAITMTGP